MGSSLQWILVTLVVRNYLITLKRCLDHVLWLFQIFVKSVRTCSCQKVSAKLSQSQRSSLRCTHFREICYQNKSTTIGVLERLSRCYDKQEDWNVLKRINRRMSFTLSWERCLISTKRKLFLMTWSYSNVYYKICSKKATAKALKKKTSTKISTRKSTKQQNVPKLVYKKTLHSQPKHVNLKKYLKLDIACSYWVHQVQERHQFGKRCSTRTWSTSVKSPDTKSYHQKQSQVMNYLVTLTIRPKRGSTVYSQR